jgi:hypothetical protein
MVREYVEELKIFQNYHYMTLCVFTLMEAVEIGSRWRLVNDYVSVRM